MPAVALLPLKDLVQAKSRLAGVLTPAERRALAQAMAEDVLRVLAGHAGIERTVLISDDPSAAMLAQAYGAQCWSERALGVQGLNAVLDSATTKLGEAGQADLLVLHADLPLLSAADLDAALTGQALADAVAIGPDRHGQGTNLLAFCSTRAPGFYFGRDSLRRHTWAVQEAGLKVALIERLGVGLDIDEPADLALLLQQDECALGDSVCGLLYESGLEQRLQASLASLAPQVFAGAGKATKKGSAMP